MVNDLQPQRRRIFLALMWAATLVTFAGGVMFVSGLGGTSATVLALFGHPISTGTVGIVLAYLGYSTAVDARRRARGLPYSQRMELRNIVGMLVFAVLVVLSGLILTFLR